MKREKRADEEGEESGGRGGRERMKRELSPDEQGGERLAHLRARAWWHAHACISSIHLMDGR
jgi:hypothetical protein